MEAESLSIAIENGGTLTLDHPNYHKDFVSIHKSRVTVHAGNIRFIGVNKDDTGEGVGTLSLTGGANTIYIERNGTTYTNHFHANAALEHSRTATLNLTGNTAYGIGPDNIRMGYAKTSGSFLENGIVPWATITGSNWATTASSKNRNDYRYYFISYTNYHTEAQGTWNAIHNINLSRNETLTAHRTINSLRIASPAFTLNLGKNHTLHIKSGGILTTGDNVRVTGRGKLTSLDGRPLYIHTYGDKLTLEAQAALGDETTPNGDVDLVKTGNGALVLNSESTHRLGTVTINQGIIKVLKGWLAVAGKIILGDGAGTDILELSANSKSRIRKTAGGLPSITLHGNPYGATSDEAILRFGGGTQQQLAMLHVQDRGVIDFASGSKSAPNILYLDHLTFNNSDARLTIRNWNYETDYLLVKYKNGNSTIPSVLKQIRFEGYDAPALWHWHFLKGFDDYWQITAVPAPEPSTTGTLLGAITLSLYVTRRNRRNSRKPAMNDNKLPT